MLAGLTQNERSDAFRVLQKMTRSLRVGHGAHQPPRREAAMKTTRPEEFLRRQDLAVPLTRVHYTT